MINLSNQTAIVTGASQGLGRGIALELANAGANLVVTHLDTPADNENAQKVVTEINRLNTAAIAIPLDVTDQTSVEACVREARKHFDRIDILVNNAGVVQKGSGITGTGLEDFALCFKVNVEGLWRISQAVIPLFKTQQSGSIINIASIAGRGGTPDIPAYSASKAAVINLTQSMARGLGVDNIRVNTVCPGIIWTPMWEEVESMFSQTNDPDVIRQQVAFSKAQDNTVLGRPQTPEDIAQAVVFLCSDSANNITGQALNVDGGIVMN